MKTIDLRSDTVTRPTPEMREAMANARVGDDVYGEDPTVNRLEAMSADLMGKEAGLFVASGTMGNLAAVLAHCQRGDEVILGNKSHTFYFEAGGVAAIAACQPYTIPNQPDGTLKLGDIRDAIRGDDPHYPVSRLIVLENTHNRCGGVSLSAAYTRSVAEIAAQNNLKLHIDGARIFNAAVAQGVEAIELVAPADSVTFCLSKGLSAPVGSVLCGSEEFIYRARRARKQLGGGMRQAGVLAAAGIVALEQVLPKLPLDHQRARLLADGLSTIPALSVDPVYTNMVYVHLDPELPLDASSTVPLLRDQGLLVGDVGPRSFRLVTHYWIDDEEVQQAVEVFRKVVSV